MKRVLFVCLGNICRSPMAEFVFKDMLKKTNRENDFTVASRATSDEAVGCGVHRGTQAVLAKHSVPCPHRTATQLVKADYERYDLIYGMDESNIRNMLRLFGGDKEGKVRLLLDREVADPWYTGNFDITYSDIVEGCKKILEEN